MTDLSACKTQAEVLKWINTIWEGMGLNAVVLDRALTRMAELFRSECGHHAAYSKKCPCYFAGLEEATRGVDEMSTMVITGGHKVYIFGLNPFYCDDGTDWIGVIEGREEECWTVEGRYFSDGHPSPWDISEEWDEVSPTISQLSAPTPEAQEKK